MVCTLWTSFLSASYDLNPERFWFLSLFRFSIRYIWFTNWCWTSQQKGWIEIFLTLGHNPGSSSQILLSGADKSKWEPDKSIVTEISTFLCRSWGTIWVLLQDPWVTLQKSSHDRRIDNATIIELSTPYLSKIVMITPFNFQTSLIFPKHMFQ